MMTEIKVANRLLNAVWNEDLWETKKALVQGADPNWIFNGYPILLHAVFKKNLDLVMMLIEAGASQTQEALGFALDRGIGEMVFPLAFLGIVPKQEEVKPDFGLFPDRYCPLDYDYSQLLQH